MTHCSLFCLLLPLVSFCGYRGNCTKGFAFFGRCFYLLFLSRFHYDHRRRFLGEQFSLRLQIVLIVSRVLLVISSPLPIGENSIVFVPCSSTFAIGVDSVVFRSTSSKLKIHFHHGHNLLIRLLLLGLLLLVASGVDHVN